MSENNYERRTISFTQADKDILPFIEELKKTNKASEFARKAIREKILRDKNHKDEDLDNRIRRIVEEILAERQIPPPQPNKTEQNNSDIELNDAILNAIDSFEL